jgi:hypothetical protein
MGPAGLILAAKDTLAIFDVAISDLAWGLLAAALIGVVGGLVYAALTNPPPPQAEAETSPDEVTERST